MSEISLVTLGVAGALMLLVLVLLLAWAKTFIHYQIGANSVKIIWMGICLRRIPFEEIESVSKRIGAGGQEKWINTFQPSHSLLVIRRKRGNRRNILITPSNRYIFRAELEKAIQMTTGNSASASDEELPDAAPAN